MGLAYLLTVLFGVRKVKELHDSELRDFYRNLKCEYEKDAEKCRKNIFWKELLKDGKFPSWEQYETDESTSHPTEYLVISPFLIRERQGDLDRYYLWRFFNADLVARRFHSSD